MTVARNSQTVLEVLRNNTAVKAQASQVVLEILRENEAEVPIEEDETSRPLQLVVAT